MTTRQQPSPTDFSNLQTDVALLKQFNEKVAEPTFKDIQTTQKEIKDALVNLDHVSHGDFDQYKVEIDKRFRDLNRRTWLQNTMSAAAGALLSGLITYIIISWISK
jgi:hypothetical protein